MEDTVELEAVVEVVVDLDDENPLMKVGRFLPLVAKEGDLPPVPFVIPEVKGKNSEKFKKNRNQASTQRSTGLHTQY